MANPNYTELGVFGLILALVLGGGYFLVNQNKSASAVNSVKPCGSCGGTQQWLQR
jgi:hypothetical protein